MNAADTNIAWAPRIPPRVSTPALSPRLGGPGRGRSVAQEERSNEGSEQCEEGAAGSSAAAVLKKDCDGCLAG